MYHNYYICNNVLQSYNNHNNTIVISVKIFYTSFEINIINVSHFVIYLLIKRLCLPRVKENYFSHYKQCKYLCPCTDAVYDPWRGPPYLHPGTSPWTQLLFSSISPRETYCLERAALIQSHRERPALSRNARVIFKLFATLFSLRE